MLVLLDEHVPNWLIRRLQSVVFWLVIAYFALGFLIVWLYLVQAATAREQSTRQATARATAAADYARCVASIPQLAKINSFLRGESDLADTLAQNSRAVLDATSSGDPQLATRKANLKRLIAARDKIGKVDEFPVPTVPECKDRFLGGAK